MLTIKLVIFHVGDTIKMLVHHADVLRKLVIRFGCWRYLINVGNMTEIRATAYRLQIRLGIRVRHQGQRLGSGISFIKNLQAFSITIGTNIQKNVTKIHLMSPTLEIGHEHRILTSYDIDDRFGLIFRTVQFPLEDQIFHVLSSYTFVFHGTVTFAGPSTSKAIRSQVQSGRS